MRITQQQACELQPGDQICLSGEHPCVQVVQQPPQSSTQREQTAGLACAPSSDEAEPPPKRPHLDPAPAPMLASSAGELSHAEAVGGDAELRAGHLRGPLLVLLCGPPGSGKSTLCAELLKHRAERDDTSLCEWRLICQDTASGGRPGKRAAVEAAAAQALGQGCSVLVDRTHLTAEQRRPFVAIGKKAGCAVHLLVLGTPLAECAERVLARRGHPSQVEGKKGVAVLKMMACTFEQPDAAAEGFASVLVCFNDSSALAAAHTYGGGVVRPGSGGN